MGKNHYRILKNMSGVNIVGLCDIAKNDDFEEPFFTELDKMLDEINPDAVIIAAPTFLHKDIAMRLKIMKYCLSPLREVVLFLNALLMLGY
jgi:predicted dehydrogenase